MDSRKVRLASTSFLMATMLLFAATALYTYYQFDMIGKIKAGLEDPLEAWSEAAYIVWKYNSTHYAARNMSTLLVDYLGTNVSQIVENIISIIGVSGGTVSFKSGAYVFETQVSVDALATMIVGEGDSTVFNFTGSGFLFNISGYHNVIEKLRITLGSSATGAILLQGATYYNFISEVTIMGAGKTVTPVGIRIQGGTSDGAFYNEIHKVRIEDVIVGVEFSKQTYRANSNLMLGGRITAVGTGINISSGSSNTFIGLTLESIDNNAVELFDALGNTFIGLFIETVSKGFYMASTANRTTILNSDIYSATTEAMDDNGNANVFFDSRYGVWQIIKQSHPTTTGWGADEKGWFWYCTTDEAVEYWNGTAIITP